MSDLHPTDDHEVTDADGSILSETPLPENSERSAIQIDGYKIKARIQPTSHGEPKPKTWKEVGTAVNAKLMSIAVNLFGVPDDLLDGTRSFIRGISALPAAVASRIDRAHEKADRAEAITQEKVATGALPAPSPEAAAERLESFLAALQADGAGVEFLALEDGRHTIVIVKPDDRQVAAELIQKALPGPAEQPGTTPAPAPGAKRQAGGSTKSKAKKPSGRGGKTKAG